MSQWTGLSLVPVMACRLHGTKPLSEPKMAFFIGSLGTNVWENLSSAKRRPFCLGLNALSEQHLLDVYQHILRQCMCSVPITFLSIKRRSLNIIYSVQNHNGTFLRILCGGDMIYFHITRCAVAIHSVQYICTIGVIVLCQFHPMWVTLNEKKEPLFNQKTICPLH